MRPEFYASTTVDDLKGGRSLEGDREPRVHEFEFLDLPAGSYDVTCLVQTDNGENPMERSTVLVNSP